MNIQYTELKDFKRKETIFFKNMIAQLSGHLYKNYKQCLNVLKVSNTYIIFIDPKSASKLEKFGAYKV